MSELIKCTSLTKRFGTLTALDNIDLSLQNGKIVGLLGPNGSGKTTLIKIINGLLTPTSGSIEICGMAPGVETKKLVAYLPDKNFLYRGTRASEPPESIPRSPQRARRRSRRDPRRRRRR